MEDLLMSKPLCSRRDFLQLMACSTMAGLASQSAVASEKSSTKRPNVIMICVDDLGYAELGCQGNDDIPTPNIDSLAKNGIRFTNTTIM